MGTGRASARLALLCAAVSLAVSIAVALAPASARAESCKPGEYEFDAETETGHIIRGQGIVVKLKSGQCGFVALWMTEDAIKNGGDKCKFGDTWSVSGSETKPVPAGGPFSGRMLVVSEIDCD